MSIDIKLIATEPAQINAKKLFENLNKASLPISKDDAATLVRHINELRRMGTKSTCKCFGIQFLNRKEISNGEWAEVSIENSPKLAAIVSPNAFDHLIKTHTNFPGKIGDMYTQEKSTALNALIKLYSDIYTSLVNSFTLNINPNSIEAILAEIAFPNENQKKDFNIKSRQTLFLAQNADGESADGLGAVDIAWTLTMKKTLLSSQPYDYKVSIYCRGVYYTNKEDFQHHYQMAKDMN